MVAPFGLHFGDAPPEAFSDLDSYTFVSSSVPSPHPDFVTYLVASAEGVGVAKIIANSEPIDGDEYGDVTRSLFEKLRAQLTTKYGEPELFDFLKVDSIWSEPRDWANAIRNRERFLSARWKRKAVNLPSELDVISLDAHDLGQGCQVSLTYFGANWPALEARMNAAEVDVL